MLKRRKYRSTIKQVILLAILFFSCFLITYLLIIPTFPASSTYAATDISMTIAPVSSITTSSSCSVELDTNQPFNYCTINTTITSNSTLGYSVFLSTPEESSTENDNTCIRHQTKSTNTCATILASHKFSPVTTPTTENGEFITISPDYSTNLASFTKGTWGVSWDDIASFANFTGVPSYSAQPLRIKNTTEFSGVITEDTTIRVAAHYNFTSDLETNQTTGDYAGSILITVINNTPPPPCSDGSCAANYDDIQEFTATECNLMSNYDPLVGAIIYTTDNKYSYNNTLAGVNTVYLTDSRDAQIYRVRKMQDGQCWMIDNLKLANYTLTSTDSDVTTSFTIPADPVQDASTRGNGVCVSGAITNIGANSQLTCNGLTTATAANYAFIAYSDPSSISTLGIPADSTTGYGYLYNFYTATAGTGGYDFGEGNPPASICPKGWSLPTSGYSGTEQIPTLHAAMGSNATHWSVTGSFEGAYAGYYTNRLEPSFIGTDVFYWSRTSFSSPNALALYFADYYMYLVDYYEKYNGMAVRCIL